MLECHYNLVKNFPLSKIPGKVNIPCLLAFYKSSFPPQFRFLFWDRQMVLDGFSVVFNVKQSSYTVVFRIFVGVITFLLMSQSETIYAEDSGKIVFYASQI